MVKLKAYIPTCDKFTNLIEANLISLERYFPKEIDIIILGYKPPACELSSNVTFISMGEDRGPRHWSTDLRNYFQEVSDEYFIYLNDDGVLIQEVTLEQITEAYKLINPSVGRLSLTHDLFSRPHKIIDDKIILAPQDSNYRCSTQYSIWNMEYFLKYLEPNLNPWDFEMSQSRKAKNDGYDIIGLKNPIFHFLHLYQRGSYRKDWRVPCHNSNSKLDKELETQISKIINNDTILFK
jgi:hypothetical protein